MTQGRVRILRLPEADAWRAALGRAPGGGEPYFQPAFYAATEQHLHGTAECFVYEEGDDMVGYPYLRRRLSALDFLSPDSTLCDLTGGYGYNGAVSTSDDPAVLRRFREAFASYCEATDVLTEFVRFHPLLGNAKYFEADCTIVTQNRNVALDLRRPLDEIRARYAHSCRKNLKKAEREQVRTVIEEGVGPQFEEFLRLYAQTMDRVQADGSYAFGRAYLEGLARELDPAPIFVYARWRGRVVSCEMALRSERMVYSYLGGTESDAFPVRPNNAVKDALIGWAHAAGCAWYVLGGGLREGDGIFRYKQTFAPDGAVDFHIGRRIYNPSVYQDVVNRWQAAAPAREAVSARLQRYWES